METTQINELLEEINSDRSVPRNIREMVDSAKKNLNKENDEPAVRISSAVTTLDEISNDPNTPIYTRTMVWNIVSMLEVMLEQSKQ